jgi:hypothetical protein
MNNHDDIVDIEGISMEKKEERNLLDDSFKDDYQPIQKNSKLFKYILYTSKIEIKSNSFIKMIYSTSIMEVALWSIGLLLFIATPKNFYMIWVLIVHLFKGILGLILLNHIPKTYEIMDALYKKENLDEENIMQSIDQIVKDTFLERWNENKTKLFIYFLFTLFCLLTDCIIFFVQLFLFGNQNYFLMEITILFIILIFFFSDIIYFLWFITLRFTFPAEMVNPIYNAITGSIIELKDMLLKYFERNKAVNSEASNN